MHIYLSIQAFNAEEMFVSIEPLIMTIIIRIRISHVLTNNYK